jgi:ParB family transcriptional regulator, chromosome partitioning protein
MAEVRGLGRGLGALIPGARPGGLKDVSTDAIRPNPWQPRTRIEPGELEELASSIREHGLLQPVLVSQQPDGTYQLIAGERRWRAAQLAGLSTLPAVVKEATPQSTLEMALVENIQRRDLNPLEEANAYRQLIDEHGLTQGQLAARLGRNRVTLANTLRLLQAPPGIRQALAEGEITEGHARAILMAEGDASRQALLSEVVQDGLSVRQTEARARRAAEPRAESDGAVPQLAPKDPDVVRLEDAFRQALGTRVTLLRGARGGRLVIHFYSEDELQGLYETFVRK